jgi:anti-sigma B factor antagonist
MQIETRKVYDVLVVDIVGRLDSRTAGDAGDRMVGIVQGGDKKIVLNLDKLDFVSSAGLRVIIQASKLLQTNHGTLNICNPRGIVKDVLQTSGFNSLLKMYDSEKDAVAAFTA